MPEEHKYIVLAELAEYGHEETFFGPFDSIEDVAKWGATTAINVPYWVCKPMHDPASVELVSFEIGWRRRFVPPKRRKKP